jgi:hypothetical protein
MAMDPSSAPRAAPRSGPEAAGGPAPRRRQAADPRELLRGINPREAQLVDAAAGLHVRLRLGGSVFPPLLFYKVFTHRPVPGGRARGWRRLLRLPGASGWGVLPAGDSAAALGRCQPADLLVLPPCRHQRVLPQGLRCGGSGRAASQGQGRRQQLPGGRRRCAAAAAAGLWQQGQRQARPAAAAAAGRLPDRRAAEAVHKAGRQHRAAVRVICAAASGHAPVQPCVPAFSCSACRARRPLTVHAPVRYSCLQAPQGLVRAAGEQRVAAGGRAAAAARG